MNLPLTPEQERIIRYADTITANSSYDGELNNECLDPFAEFWRINKSSLPPALLQIKNEIIAMQPNNSDGTTVDIEITKKYITDGFTHVRNHLLNNGYIDKPDFDRKWILTDVGKKMKQLKGHINYQKYEAKKLKAELAEMNGKIYWKRRAFASALIGLISGILISWIAIKLGLPTPLRTQQPEVQQSNQPPSLDTNK